MSREARFWDRMAPHHGHPDETLQRALDDALDVLSSEDRVLDVGCAASRSSRRLAVGWSDLFCAPT